MVLFDNTNIILFLYANLMENSIGPNGLILNGCAYRASSLHGCQASNSVNVHFLMTFLMFMYDILRGLFIFVIGEVSSAIPKLN